MLAIDDALPGSPGDRAMGYDLLDRLISVNAGSAQGGAGVYGYDGLDNIRRLDQGARTVRHQYATADLRLSSTQNSAGTTLYTFGYDSRGNQTTRTNGSGTIDDFTFDAANRLTGSVTRTLGAVSTASYVYDGFGRRVKETTGGLATYSGYGHDGQLIHQLDQKVSPMLSTDYIYLAGSLIAERVTPVGGTTYTTYLHTDALGSPVASTDALGAVTFNRQTAYGEPADASWESGPGFTGHVVDGQSRLVYMQQRYYDPSLGRFLSSDPVLTDTATGDSLARYSYALNSPHVYVDPDGRNAGLVVRACVVRPQICMLGMGSIAVATVWVQSGMAEQAISDLTLLTEQVAAGDEDAAPEDEADPNGPFTSEDKERGAKGADGGVGVITTETDGGGETSSTTHTVTVDGEVVHQHTDHHGRHGSRRRFPEEWTGRRDRGEGRQKPVPEDRGPNPPRPEPRQRERWPQP